MVKKFKKWSNYSLFNPKMVEINLILSTSYNQSLNSSSDFEFDRFQRSNSDGLKSESSTIRFVGPKCLR